jgi:Protein of unknown function (DUF2845)
MRTLFVTLGFTLIIAATAVAQPMQCGTGIINPGDSQERVLELCGRPAASKEWTQTIPDDDDGGVDAQINWAEWAYQNGPDQFVNKVVFRNGAVYEIKQ